LSTEQLLAFLGSKLCDVLRDNWPSREGGTAFDFMKELGGLNAITSSVPAFPSSSVENQDAIILGKLIRHAYRIQPLFSLFP